MFSIRKTATIQGIRKYADKEVIQVLKTEFEIVAVGKPNIAELTDNEQRIFFETLFARVLELAKEKKEN